MTAKLRRSGPASYSLAKEGAIRSQPRSAPTIMVYLPGMYRPVLQRSYPREPKIDSTKLALSRGFGWFISGGFSQRPTPASAIQSFRSLLGLCLTVAFSGEAAALAAWIWLASHATPAHTVPLPKV